MVVKRSFWTYLELHGLFSLLFGFFFALGLAAYFSSDATSDVLLFGLIFSCLFGSLFGLTQLVFAGIYCFSPREMLEVHQGIVSLRNWGSRVSFPVAEIVRWDYHKGSPTNYISFLLYDGRRFVADAVMPLSIEHKNELAAYLACPEGEIRRLHKDSPPFSKWAIQRDLMRWPFLLVSVGIFLSIFTAWAWIGFGLGSPSQGYGDQVLLPRNPILGILGGVSSFLCLIDWAVLLLLTTLPKERAVFTEKEVRFHSRGKEIRLPYSQIASIKDDQRVMNGSYSALAVPCLYLQSGNETYTIRFVRVSEENEEMILRLSGFICKNR